MITDSWGGGEGGEEGKEVQVPFFPRKDPRGQAFAGPRIRLLFSSCLLRMWILFLSPEACLYLILWLVQQRRKIDSRPVLFLNEISLITICICKVRGEKLLLLPYLFATRVMIQLDRYFSESAYRASIYSLTYRNSESIRLIMCLRTCMMMMYNNHDYEVIRHSPRTHQTARAFIQPATYSS